MDSHDKRYYELTVINKLERSRHLKDDLTDMLKKTKGGNNYLSERGGISFGIHKCFMTSSEGDDVIMVPELQFYGEQNSNSVIIGKLLRKSKKAK